MMCKFFLGSHLYCPHQIGYKLRPR